MHIDCIFFFFSSSTFYSLFLCAVTTELKTSLYLCDRNCLFVAWMEGI